MRRRIAWSAVAAAAVVGLVAAYLAVGSNGASAGQTTATTGAAGVTVVELSDGANRVLRLAPGGPAVDTGLRCLRVYTAAGITTCLRISGPGPTYAATVTGPGGSVLRDVALPGIPSRARVSASGHIVTWTAFVTGDSYSIPGGFSTRTGYLDLRTGALTESVEHYAVTVGGQPFSAVDANYWGMTVAADDRTFYATLGSGDRTWLMRGDLVTATMSDVRRGAECPSLSPDGKQVAYKKRVSRLGPWELAVLDLASGVERVLPGTVGIDDQAEWLDGATLAYAAVPEGGRVAAVWQVRADGSAPAVETVPDATSPVGAHPGGAERP